MGLSRRHFRFRLACLPPAPSFLVPINSKRLLCRLIKLLLSLFFLQIITYDIRHLMGQRLPSLKICYSHMYQRGSRDPHHEPSQAGSRYGPKSFSFVAPTLWNSLPDQFAPVRSGPVQGRVAKNILRLRELVTIISKQQVILPEHKLRAFLSLEASYATQPKRRILYELNFIVLRIKADPNYLAWLH